MSAAVLLVVTLNGKARADPVTATLFPQASAPITTDRALVVRLAAGLQVRLVSVRFAPKPGLTPWGAAKWCGLVIAEAGKPAGALLTIGSGSLQALSCTGLEAAGMVPPRGPARRIGLLYRTRSPNFAGTTPVVLVEDAKAGWKIDVTATDTLDALRAQPTLGRLRAALAPR